MPPVRTRDGVELKFNPYHDPANGQFTFAPGGESASSEVLRGTRQRLSARLAAEPAEPIGRGGNARAFEDPMTLEESFPGLHDAPGGAIIAVADSVLSITGPAKQLKAALLDDWSKQVQTDIGRVDPHWFHATLGPITTIEGKIYDLNNLRLERAAIILRATSDPRPLQVETLRFIQQHTDIAYEEGPHCSRLDDFVYDCRTARPLVILSMHRCAKASASNTPA